MAQTVKRLPTMQETQVQSLGQEGLLEKGLAMWASLVAQMVKRLPTMRETWVQSLGWEDPLEKGTGEYPLQYSGLKNSMDYSIGLQRATFSMKHCHCFGEVCFNLGPFH